MTTAAIDAPTKASSFSIVDNPAVRQAFGIDQLLSTTQTTSIWLIVAGLVAIAIGAVLIWIGVEALREYQRLPDDDGQKSIDSTDEMERSARTKWLETAAILTIVFGALALLNPTTLFTSFGIMNLLGLAMVIVAAIALTFLYKYRAGKMSKREVSIAKTSSIMTITLGALNYILFLGLPLLVGGSVLNAYSSRLSRLLPELRAGKS